MSSSSASSSITSPSPTSNNLVPNSGFEATAASNVYWADRSGRNAIGVSNTATFKVTANSDTAPHSGSQMAAITIKANNVFGSFSQSFPMTPNTQYTISGWYWVPNTANNCALSFYANKPRSQISNTEQSYFIAPRADIRGAAQEQQWIQVSGTFNSGRFDTLEYYVQTSCTTGPVPRVLYFDDMSVTPV
ncbi:MAG: hypothetical protein LQ352_001938 [Teloschistes flavicans]|nr:MAG: hypothetical protein LQ352_001938 [Teloschistes flavicans]